MSLRTSMIRSSLCALKVQRVKAGGNLEIVRFRKPRFEPKAASKVYRVREPTPIIPEEHELMKDWTRKYNTEMKSIRSYLMKHYQKLDAHIASQTKPVSLHSEMKEMEKKNRQFNRISKQIRDRAMKERRDRERLVQAKLEERANRELDEMKRKAEAKMILEKTLFEESVRPENLDEKVERLLNTRQDHNYPITKKGRIVKNTQTDKSSEEKEKAEN